MIYGFKLVALESTLNYINQQKTFYVWQDCENATEGNWPTYALEDLIESAGIALYYRSIDTIP